MLFVRAAARIIARARGTARIEQLRRADFTPGAQRPSRKNPAKTPQKQRHKRNIAQKSSRQ